MVHSNKEKVSIAELLASHEEAIGNLYKEFAEKFGGMKDFWTKLSAEETQHAYWLRRLNARIEKEGCGYINTEQFRSEAVEESLRKINKKLEELRQSDIFLKDVLEFAMQLEESILENKYFDLFVGDIAEIKQVQYCLAEVVDEHRERILKVLEEQE